MDKSLKRQIINTAESVKKKIRKMRNIQADSEKVLETVFKPLIKPLTQITKKSDINKLEDYKENEEEYYNDTVPYNNNKEQKQDSDYSDCSADSFESTNLTNETNETAWSLTSEMYEDVPYGVRMENGKLMLGGAKVSVNNKLITVGGAEYETTPGLYELLFKKDPNLELVTDNDKQNYKIMLLTTNAHRRDHDSAKPIKSNKGKKYLQVIKPLFKLTVSDPKGAGLPTMKKWNKSVDYVYWNDPNELVDRLKLLIASRDAGNTGLDNEIISIIEELREDGFIN